MCINLVFITLNNYLVIRKVWNNSYYVITLVFKFK